MSATMAERIVPLGRETLRLVAWRDPAGCMRVATEMGRYGNTGEWLPSGPLFHLRPTHLRAVASALSALASELGVSP